jgi:AcrR family transcriptional regulator
MDETSAAAVRLLAAAERLFGERGLDGVSVRELVEDAGVTRPVLYYYFGSKEGLYREAVRRSEKQLGVEVARVGDRTRTARDRIFRVCRTHAEAIRTRTLAVSHGTHTTRARIVAAIRALLAEGAERDEFGTGDLEAVSIALAAAAEFVGAHASVASGPRQDVLDRVLSVVLQSISRPSPTARPGT